VIQIRAIQIRSVASLEDVKLEFAPGLNLVCGDNEAGKTTILRAIAGTLFGVDDQSLCPVGYDGDYGAALRLEIEDQTFVFDRNFANNRIQLFQIINDVPEKIFDAKCSPRGRSADVKAYRERLKELLGSADRDLFESSVFLLDPDFSLGEADTVRKIKQILAGQATHDYDAVTDALWTQYFQITSVNPEGRNKSKARRLESLVSDRASVDSQLQTATQARFEIEQLQGQIEQTDTQIGQMEKTIRSTNRVVTVAADYFKYDQEKKEHEQKHGTFAKEKQRVVDLKARLETHNQKLAKLGVAASVDDATAENLRRRVSLDTQIAQQQKVVDQAQKDRDSVGAESKMTLVLLGGIAGLFLVGGAVFLAMIGWEGGIALFAGAGLFILFASMVRQRGKRILRRDLALAVADKEIDRLHQQIAALVLPESIAALGAQAIPQILADREKSLGLLREKEKAQAQLEVLPSSEDVAEALVRLEREIAVLLERQSELSRTHPELAALDHDKLMDEMAKLVDQEEQIEQLKQKRGQLHERLILSAANAKSPDALRDQSEDLAERIGQLEFRRDALTQAIEAVRDAVKEYRGEYLVDFSKQVSKVFASMVGDAGRSVLFGSGLDPRLVGPSGQLALENLSTGTRDQLYFAGRIALSRRLTEQRALPIILDDPLVHFDATRKAGTLRMLDTVAADHQVILFSHEASLADLVSDRVTVLNLSE
jgi:uncharacterized protein YhaN